MSQPGPAAAAAGSPVRSGAAGVPSGAAAAGRLFRQPSPGGLRGAGTSDEVRSCLRQEAQTSKAPSQSSAAPWQTLGPLGVRFKGTESLASFHVIDQELPPEARLSQRLGAWGEVTIHPRMLGKMPSVNKAASQTLGSTASSWGGGGVERWNTRPPSSSRAPAAAASGGEGRGGLLAVDAGGGSRVASPARSGAVRHPNVFAIRVGPRASAER